MAEGNVGASAETGMKNLGRVLRMASEKANIGRIKRERNVKRGEERGKEHLF